MTKQEDGNLERETERRQTCEEGGRDGIDAATSQGSSGPTRAKREKEGSPSRNLGGSTALPIP